MTMLQVDADLIERIQSNETVSAVYKAAWIAAVQELAGRRASGHRIKMAKFAERYGVNPKTASKHLRYLTSLGVVNYSVMHKLTPNGLPMPFAYLAAGPLLCEPERVVAIPERNGWGGKRARIDAWRYA